jgi:Asp-tRNA(Asn)/Glu-tRNA(Gln) amidotransferase A subunit family amidase
MRSVGTGFRGDWPRRRVLKLLAAVGVGSGVFGRAVVALAAGHPEVTSEMLDQASWISGIELTPEERELMLEGVNDLLAAYETNRQVELANGVPPALMFRPLQEVDGTAAPRRPIELTGQGVTSRPVSEEDLAYSSVSRLAGLLRRRQVSSVELTRLYLERLRRYDPRLECVITLTEELALEQAERADREIAAGRYRGPLHGIPWGAKDLLAVPGYPTTWGAAPYKNQVLAEEATVVSRLERAGAVLIAKLSLGALAWGDVWFGGKTKNPWNLEQGSSGSSAGSAAAVAAGLVGFAIGTETWGSIVSPCSRCGVTGLRPTFGRVSRHGAMALSWSMDKIGPIARSVEDSALVFDAIEGADGLDPTAVDGPFRWPYDQDIISIRVGYAADLFEKDRTEELEEEDPEDEKRLQEWQEIDRRSLQVLRDLGFELIPVALPDRYPVQSLSFVLDAEAACLFDDLTRSGRDDLMVRQIPMAWPNAFRQAQTVPAVEYLRANRIRTLVMQEMQERLAAVDVYVAPSFVGDNLLLTNLTGHPSVVLPNGFSSNGAPTSITFVGQPHAESALLAVAHLYQQATDYHRRRPPLPTSAG